MKLPFTIEQFLQVFRNYNTAIFPLQVLFYLLALVVIALSIKKIRSADKFINIILAFFWLWMGVVYHLVFFATINKAAYLFGGLFIIQSVLFFYYGFINPKLKYHFTQNAMGVTGLILVIFALVVYPLLGYVYGHIYPAAPTFGLPCPVSVFSFGVLLWSERKFPKIVLIIPFLWSLLGFSAATTLGIKEDTGLIVAGILATAILLLRKRGSTVSNSPLQS
jgi:hypothetical protein